VISNRYGVRIYVMPDSDVILIKQTVKRLGSQRYVIDTLGDGMHREKHIGIDDSAGIASAVRAALKGKLI
jgi:hypothetical protein